MLRDPDEEKFDYFAWYGRKMKTQELRLKSKEELAELLRENRKKFDEERFLAREGKAKNVKSLKLIRKDIARILTLLGEKAEGRT